MIVVFNLFNGASVVDELLRLTSFCEAMGKASGVANSLGGMEDCMAGMGFENFPKYMKCNVDRSTKRIWNNKALTIEGKLPC